MSKVMYRAVLRNEWVRAITLGTREQAMIICNNLKEEDKKVMVADGHSKNYDKEYKWHIQSGFKVFLYGKQISVKDDLVVPEVT